MNSRKFLHFVVACALGSAACERGPSGVDTEPPSPARSVMTVEWVGPMPARLLGGLTIPVHFRALDGAGKPVAGVELAFSAAAESGSFQGANARVTTDSLGIARTEWTLGIAGGEQQAEARVVGGPASGSLRLPVSQGAADPPRFTQRAITLAGPICAAEGQISGTNRHAFDGYTIAEPDVLLPRTLQARTGTTSWMYIGFIGVVPGMGRVVARDSYGRTDTLSVTVGGALPTVSLPDTLRVVVGDSAIAAPVIGGPCKDSLQNPFISTGFYADSTRNRATSLASDVFAAQPRTPRPGFRVVGLKAGTGKVAYHFWGGVDTAIVVVK